MIEWSRLRVLDAVARAGSVGGAAQDLHMTSPAISHQLRRIETELGARVVEPQGRGMRLTDEGRVLADCARRVADLVQRAENDVAGVAEAAGTVRIGALASVVRGFVAPVLARVRTSHPGIRMELVDGESVDHVAALRTGRLDLVVDASWSPRPAEVPAGVLVDDLGAEDVWLAVPSNSSDAEEPVAAMAEFADAPWTSCPAGSEDHGALVQAARADGADVDIRYEVGDHVTQVALVAAGLAVALVPGSTRSLAPAGVAFRRLEPPIRRALRLLRRRGEEPRAVTTVAGSLRDAGRRLGPPAPVPDRSTTGRA